MHSFDLSDLLVSISYLLKGQFYHNTTFLYSQHSRVYARIQVSCQDVSHVSLVLEIISNTLIFMFLTTSGAHNLAYGLLISSQLPLHLLTVTLSG